MLIIRGSLIIRALRMLRKNIVCRGADPDEITRACVVLYIIETIHTCNIFDITIIIVMSDLHVRIMCRCTTWNVVI